MPNPLAIDAHAHICTEETMKLLNKETPKVASALEGDRQGHVTSGPSAGVPYRPLPLGGFDIEQRLKDMKASDVDMQVLSNTPQTFMYNQDAGLTAAACIIQNDQIAKHVRDYPRSFYGIATLPMQAPKAAADELERAISKLGSRACRSAPTSTARISTSRSSSRCGRWRTRTTPSAWCIRTTSPAHDRLKNYYLNNLIGNPLDTTIAAACLVFGGVIERFPNIKLLHGAWRRLHAVSGRALAARLARPPRAAEASEEAAGRDHPHASTGTPSCTPSRSLNSWCRSSARRMSSSAATIPTTWARSNARGRSRRCRAARWTSSTMLNGLVQKLLAGREVMAGCERRRPPPSRR